MEKYFETTKYVQSGGGGIDVSDTTALPSDVLSGKYFHVADGSLKEGEMQPSTSVMFYPDTDAAVQMDSLGRLSFHNLYPGWSQYLSTNTDISVGVDMDIDWGNATVNDVKVGKTFTNKGGIALEGTYDPGTAPSGTIDITTNGTHNVYDYEYANVQIPGPSGTYSATQNGTYDISDYQYVDVNVAGSTPFDLLWTNPNPTQAYVHGNKIELDLTGYAYVMVIVKANTTTDRVPRAMAFLPVLQKQTPGTYEYGGAVVIARANDRIMRKLTAVTNGIVVGYGSSAATDQDSSGIPLYVFGIKNDFKVKNGAVLEDLTDYVYNT